MQKSHKKISGQFLRYAIAAGAGYFFDIITLFLLHEIFGVHYLIAAATGFVIGLVVLYVLTKLFVFGDSKIKSKALEFALFTIIGVIGLIILSISMWILTGLIEINYLLSKIISTVFVYTWNFLARRSLYHD